MPGSTDLIGSIQLFASPFFPHKVPKGWVLCDGRLITISENPGLFMVLGTQFGGDGRFTAGVPDLRGRVPVGIGNHYVVGETGGWPVVALNNGNIPHTHTVFCHPEPEGEDWKECPKGHYFARDSKELETGPRMNYSGTPTHVMNEGMVKPEGQTAPEKHENMQPYLVLCYCICDYGVYPPRSENETGEV